MVALMITFLLIILASCYTLASHVIRHLKLPDALEPNEPPPSALEAALCCKSPSLSPGPCPEPVAGPFRSGFWDYQSGYSVTPFVFATVIISRFASLGNSKKAAVQLTQVAFVSLHRDPLVTRSWIGTLRPKSGYSYLVVVGVKVGRGVSVGVTKGKKNFAASPTSQIMVLIGNKPLYRLVRYRPSGNASPSGPVTSIDSVPAPV